MKYKGKLYAKFGNKYIQLLQTAEDYDNLQEENKKLKEVNQEYHLKYRKVLKEAVKVEDERNQLKQEKQELLDFISINSGLKRKDFVEMAEELIKKYKG